ncbi:MAG: molybdopterin molybdenumtransferase MoeA [Verrucomicrobia bacterium]|nr:MAG: molybdopterin molybdenumtransferase MoeA [Verrucomicrobiota bacterium]
MLELEEAQQRILSGVTGLGANVVPLSKAAGRFLAASVHSAIKLPPFDNSAMDGYAVRAGEVASAGPKTPVILKLAGKVAAGECFSGEVRPGGCVWIFTGSPLPAGLDAVVMQEDTRVDESDPSRVVFLDSIKPWENVRFVGEDVKLGTILTRTGDRLTPGRLGLLAAAGITEVQCARQPVVGLLATGSELLEPGTPLAAGKIYESNRTSLAALAAQAGAVPKIFPLAPDTPSATGAALERALAQCDLVITTGGVSVGEMDLVKHAFSELGGITEFWKIAMKPGRPFVFGHCAEKLWFGLPGNPVSAFVTFLLLVRPALLRYQGATEVDLAGHQGTLIESLSNSGERRHFMRVKIDETATVRSAGVQASHVMSSLAEANGLIDVPPQTTFVTGTTVRVMRWE